MLEPPKDTVFIDAQIPSILNIRRCSHYRSESKIGKLLLPSEVCGAECYKTYELGVNLISNFRSSRNSNISELFPLLVEQPYDFSADQCGVVFPGEIPRESSDIIGISMRKQYFRAF